MEGLRRQETVQLLIGKTKGTMCFSSEMQVKIQHNLEHEFIPGREGHECMNFILLIHSTKETDLNLCVSISKTLCLSYKDKHKMGGIY